MVKILLNINKIFLGIFFLASIFSLNNIAYAADSKINAGILSDVWFSNLSMDRDQNVTIYGSFQNSEDVDLTGKVSFWLNENKINTFDFNAPSGKVIKLETPWKTEIGDFEIKVVVDSVAKGATEINPDNLIKKGTSLKIKISRKIDIEYITEVGTNVYNNTVKTIDKVVENTNQKLENAKTKVISSGGNNSGGSGTNNNAVNSVVSGNVGSDSSSNGVVAGIQYSSDDTGEGWVNDPNKASSGKNIKMGQGLVTDLKNSPFEAVKNLFITISQFVLKYWQISLGIIIFATLFLFFKRRSYRK